MLASTLSCWYLIYCRTVWWCWWRWIRIIGCAWKYS